MSRQRVLDAIFVAGATCIGAWLRLRQLGVPCFWLDEIIHYDGATGATNAAFLLNASNGNLLTTITTNSKDFGQPVFADSMLLIPTNSQGLMAFHP